MGKVNVGQHFNLKGKDYTVRDIDEDDVSDIYTLEKSGGSSYQVRYNKSVNSSKPWSHWTWSCQCRAWAMSGEPRECKHTRALSQATGQKITYHGPRTRYGANGVKNAIDWLR